MNENNMLKVKELLYNTDLNEVKNMLSKTEDEEVLYVYAYNYNWDNGFEIPKVIIDNRKCDLSIALLIFYNADGFNYLLDKTERINLPLWSTFIKELYDDIIHGKYKKGEIEYKVFLSKVELFKLQKLLKEEEYVFISNLEGKCLDINI